MSSFEWLELQTLTEEIAAARSQLAAARAAKDRARSRSLEAEITAAERRRDRLLAHITTDLVGVGEPGGPVPADTAAALPPPPPVEEAADGEMAAHELPPAAADDDRKDAAPTPEDAPVAELPAAGAAPEAPAQPDETITKTADAALPEMSGRAASLEGGSMPWDQLTPSDIERAKHELGVRRAEMLARHADELKALEGDQAQIEMLEQAIATFTQKFAQSGVVKLEDERELRQGRN